MHRRGVGGGGGDGIGGNGGGGGTSTHHRWAQHQLQPSLSSQSPLLDDLMLLVSTSTADEMPTDPLLAAKSKGPSSSSDASSAPLLPPSSPSCLDIFVRGMGTLWPVLGAAPVLACFVASLPLDLPPAQEGAAAAAGNNRGRDTLLFAGIASILTALRFVYTCVVPKHGIKDLSSFHAWVQLVCSCTLFLLFCQGFDGHLLASLRKKKANGTLLSSIETYAEHAYTLPLLAACRLAYSSFGMDEGGSGNSGAAAARAQGKKMKGGGRGLATSTTTTASAAATTFLRYLDMILGILCPLILFVMAFALVGVNDSHSAAGVDAATGGSAQSRFLQWVLFLQLAYTHLCQDDFVLVDRRADSLIRGGILILGCILFHLMLPTLHQQQQQQGPSSSIDYFMFKVLSENFSRVGGHIVLRVWAALLSCRWYVCVCALIRQRFEGMKLDIWDRHAADADDVCFSVAAAAIFCASYASLPPSSEGEHQHRTQTFALVTVTTQSLPFMAGIWLVQWLVTKVFYRERVQQM